MIEEILESHFGIANGEIIPLDGYANSNFRVTDGDRNFVLKMYDAEPRLEGVLEAETEALLLLDGTGGFEVPVPQPDRNGHYVFSATVSGSEKYIRLLSFVEGELLGNAVLTPDLLFSFGRLLAKLDQVLSGFRRDAIDSRRSLWDQQHYGLNRPLVKFIADAQKRKLVEYFFLQAREFVDPHTPFLRRGTIHGDANEWNVLVNDGLVTGIIDFGDLYRSPLINELAIAAAYSLMYVDEPVTGAIPLVKGYAEIIPLEEREIGLLYHLIAIRLCTSVCNSARARRETPEHEYAVVSEKRAWSLLERWVSINPLRIEDGFRRAAGFESKLSDTIADDLAARKSNTSAALSLDFSEPVKMTGAAFQYMFDSSGDTYLDCCNNIPQVGHCHPKVVKALSRSAARLNTNTRYLSDTFNEYAGRLLSMFPEELGKVFFVNSGSAAADLAVRLASAHTGRGGIAVLEHGYHGNTRLGIELSHYKYAGKGGGGRKPDVIELPLPDTYKGRYSEDDGTAGRSYAEEARELILDSGIDLAAFIAEPIVGCGGQVPLAEGYSKEMYGFVRGLGGVCISDEVQTGFGRLGESFWGFEMHDARPDIVVLGKPIANGHPMGAVVTTAEIASSFETGMEFFSSFGGNTVSCAVGLAVLDVIEEERLPGIAAEVGGYLLERLKAIVRESQFAGDARGSGLFLGLELVKDKLTKEPNTELAANVREKLKQSGILVGIDGPARNVIKIKPPLCFTMENADQLADGLENLLRRANVGQRSSAGVRI